MMKLENLRDLFIQHGRELYDCNEQEIAELPKILNEVSSPQLRKILERQLNKAENQRVRMREAFLKINSNPAGEECVPTRSILKQVHDRIEKSQQENVKDAGIIAGIQILNHRKISGLGSAISFAREIGQEESARSFHEALLEEKEIDKELSELAEKEINRRARLSVHA